jgi:oligopeptidase A
LNIRKANSFIIIPKHDLIGLTDNQLKNLVDLGDGTFKIGVDYPTYALIMSYCQNRDVRKLLYNEFERVGYPENHSILITFIRLQHEKALLLGYQDFPSYDIQDNMAKSVSAVEKMLQYTFDATKEKAIKEKEVLVSFAKKEFADSFGGECMPWDVSYIHQMYKNKYFNLDEKEIAEYFPASVAIKNIFEVYEKFFGIKMELVDYSDSSWKYDE